MFRLTGELWKSEKSGSIASAFCVWQPEAVKKIPPAFRIDYIDYRVVRRDAIIEWIPEPPTFNGYWGKITISAPATFEEINLGGYNFVSTPYSLQQVWLSEDRQAFYFISAGQNPLLNVELKITLYPDVVSNESVIFTLPLLELDCISIEVAGLIITEGETEAAFTRQDDQVTLHISPQYQLDYESDYLFTFAGQLSTEAVNSASIFYVDLEDISQFEYMGGGLTQNFREGDVAVGRFTFDEEKKILVVFLGEASVPRAQQEMSVDEGKSGLISGVANVVYKRPLV